MPDPVPQKSKSISVLNKTKKAVIWFLTVKTGFNPRVLSRCLQPTRLFWFPAGWIDFADGEFQSFDTNDQNCSKLTILDDNSDRPNDTLEQYHHFYPHKHNPQFFWVVF